MTISVVGAGYVGLVTAAVMADFGHKVYCVDIDKKKVTQLNQGRMPFFEPGLAELVKKGLLEKRLLFTTSFAESIGASRVVFICVGTPPGGDGDVDLSYLLMAAEDVAKNLKSYTLIAIKSTVPIGVEDQLEGVIKRHTKARFEFASVPEFLREGSAISDMLHPDRIVIGTKSKKAADILFDLHKHISGERVVCDLRSAQLVKYVANSLLATKVSFANAVANLCEKIGADASKVLWGVGLDRRIGHFYLSPGVGYGGSCLPKDVAAFIHVAKRFDYDFELLEAVDQINEEQINNFLEKIKRANGEKLGGKTLAILGLSFKPNTDDLRDAPSIKIINRLLDEGVRVQAYDPVAIPNAKKIFGGRVVFSPSPYEALREAEAMIIVTEWNEFRELDLAKAKKLMRKPVIVDGRNIYDAGEAKAAGFTYVGIGQ